MDLSDSDLLRQYTRERSQASFTELVRRHVDLVYSAAKRQVRSAALAEEIAQSVFIDLSRAASTIKPGTPLVAWLHVVTRRTALDVIRKESRRQAREHLALEISTVETHSSVWTTLEPLLDEAVDSLAEPDRHAVLLRFFENKSLREVGAALGVSDDAAQKRLGRAVEQLRRIFRKHGVSVTATGLVADLSAHVVATTPIGLATTISSAVSSLGTTVIREAAIAQTAQTLAMTTFQKSLVAVALSAVAGAGLYEATVFAREKANLAALRNRTTEIGHQLSESRAEQNTATARLRTIETQIDSRLAASSARIASGDAALELQMKAWLANLDQLKRILAERPKLDMPEMQLLSETNWFEAASNAKLDSEEGIRTALSGLRQVAENRMMNKIRAALNRYTAMNGGVLPSMLPQLLPFFDPPIDASLLARYELHESGKPSELPARKRKYDVIGVKAPIDVEYDTYWTAGLDGFTATTAMDLNITEARSAFSAAHGGQSATTAAQLIPYLKWPASEAAVLKLMNPPLAVSR